VGQPWALRHGTLAPNTGKLFVGSCYPFLLFLNKSYPFFLLLSVVAQSVVRTFLNSKLHHSLQVG
jgi:hypothetical protein